MTVPIPSKTIDELNTLARDIYTNRVFTTDHLHEYEESLVHLVFMPVALGCFADMPKEDRDDLGMLYANYKDAGPRSINGLPMFMAVNCLNKSDTQVVRDKLQTIMHAVEYMLEHPKGE